MGIHIPPPWHLCPLGLLLLLLWWLPCLSEFHSLLLFSELLTIAGSITNSCWIVTGPWNPLIHLLLTFIFFLEVAVPIGLESASTLNLTFCNWFPLYLLRSVNVSNFIISFLLCFLVSANVLPGLFIAPLLNHVLYSVLVHLNSIQHSTFSMPL